ncbi:cytochrome P450 [Mycolicibacterium senegalense]|uniref:cytochrome P450 n=1 Tax=Mycolicibacterium TaxID=1866885 RepID=UPI003204A1D2
MRRTATRDVELGGQRIRAGDKVVVWMNAANRDPAVFDHPHRIDLAREHNPHVVFGHGVNFCLGTRLARLQLARMLGELAPTCPGLQVVGPAERMPSTFMDAVVKLPVEV